MKSGHTKIMKTTRKRSLVATALAGGLAVTAVITSTAMAGTADKKVITPPEPADKWEVLLAIPGWLAGVEGDIGLDGRTSAVQIGFGTIRPHLDMAASLRGEVRKGRFGAQMDFIYMSLSDGVGGSGMVQNLHVRIDQLQPDLGVSYRLVEGKRGWVDARAGFRYTNLFQSVTVFPNHAGIQAASTQLVDTASTLAGDALRSRVSQIVNDKLSDLSGQSPTLPMGPLGGQVSDAIRDRVQAIIDSRKAEIAAAIASGVQPTIAAAKARLSNEISQELTGSLNTQVSRTDDWFDPYVGLRARYNFNEKFYFLAKADIGGFGVGSDLTWQASGSFGWEINRRVFVEAGYRCLYVDYQGNGFTYNTYTKGAEITFGVRF
jgi:hypothetical protein